MDGPGSQAPAATRALRVLRFLATQPDPVTLHRIAGALQIPRSSAYHLVNVMIAEGFVTHLEDEHRYALGVAAFEVGSGYTRQAPLQRIARRPLADLVDSLGESAHLAVLHGRDIYYVLEERAPGRPPLVSDVGVRLPAHLTASGRAILALLPARQVRALYPDRLAFVTRYDTGPTSLSALTTLLGETRRRGHAREDGDVTPGFSSVASAVADHSSYPIAAVAVTFPSLGEVDVDVVVRRVAEVASALSRRLGASAADGPPARG
jgi:DNA-binding IclR family transcriptional regulator